MRFAHGPRLAFLTSVVLAACGGREPIKGDASVADAPQAKAGTKGNDGGAAGTTGKAGTTGAAGVLGAAGVGVAGTNGPGSAGTGVIPVAGSTGAAGVTGIAGTTGSAGIIGAAGSGSTPQMCKPGSLYCFTDTYAYRCLPNGTWTVDGIKCPYGCFNGVCKVCFLGESQCTSATSEQDCLPDGTGWSMPIQCINGCGVNGKCMPSCMPGSSECVTNFDRHVCQPGGKWGLSLNCPNGCLDGACLECQPFTGECLTAKTGHKCTLEGKWDQTFTCGEQCDSGQCTDCGFGATMCADDKHIRSCNENGTWDAPSECGAGVCAGDACRSCFPGKTQCASGDAVQICGNDGEWGEWIGCTNACKAGACTTNPKKVFVTSTAYKGGDLGGLDGADAKCQARAVAAGLTGTFRAWLSDFDGTPQTRFTQDGGPYLLVTGSVVANNWTGLTSGSLRHAINVTELGTSPPAATTPNCDAPIVWTNTNQDGSLGDAGLTCGDWTDSTGFMSWWGTTNSQSQWTQACVSGTSAATGCGAVAPIFCFEQ